MGALAGLVNTTVDAATGTARHTTLEDFLNKFNSSAGKYVETIDPFTTFDVVFKFFPNDSTSNKKNLAGILKDAGLGMLENLADNATGGLYSSISNRNSSDNFDSLRAKCNRDCSFINYLYKANLLDGDMLNNTLELSLGEYIQEVTIPHLTIPENNRTTTLIGEFPVNGMYVKPDNNQLIMQVLNTKAALHERIFYPWLKETTLSYWSYASQPYTTATITVDFTKHNDCKYVFCGCRPFQIYSLQGKQDVSGADNLTRQVMFNFDFMYITSDKLDVVEDLKDKLLSTGKTLFNSAAKAINI